MDESQLIFNDTMSEGTIGELLFFMSPAVLPWFNELLQRGFYVTNSVGITIQEFLTRQIGLSKEYIGQKLSTILLDGKIVGDIGSAIIKRGSVLALSSAMPGLVGAAMRRGGVYSALRNSITYQETGNPCVLKEGTVHMKLFNLLMNDLGPHLLKKGILVRSMDLADFLSKRSEAFWTGCRNIFLNEKSLSIDQLRKGNPLSRYGMIHLSVKT